MTNKVAHGREIFHSTAAGCSSCHGLDGNVPDGIKHDVGSKALADRSIDFDTPSLRSVGGTAPYFHDGRYATLAELLDSTDGDMGHTSHLSRTDRDALEAYLRAL
jgi:cytochrome c peroxidase